ncbi:hypothetical protein BDR03DRAFT_940503 [Suillus americanus]|nr:hypothetical protein BDR03DRAFT_940503 [Suillus americanus]
MAVEVATILIYTLHNRGISAAFISSLLPDALRAVPICIATLVNLIYFSFPVYRSCILRLRC